QRGEVALLRHPDVQRVRGRDKIARPKQDGPPDRLAVWPNDAALQRDGTLQCHLDVLDAILECDIEWDDPVVVKAPATWAPCQKFLATDRLRDVVRRWAGDQQTSAPCRHDDLERTIRLAVGLVVTADQQSAASARVVLLLRNVVDLRLIDCLPR